MKSKSCAKKHRHGAVLGFIVFAALLLACCGIAYWFMENRGATEKDTSKLITNVVAVGPFDHIVLEQGEIESSKNIELDCKVESRGTGGTAILWVIDEGTRVTEGEKLVELDASQLEQSLKTQRIAVLNADANVASAEALVKQAEISRQEYLEGTFKTEEKAILSEVAVAEQELRKAKLALASTQRLVAKGLVKSLQMEADQFAVANTVNQLEAAQGRLRVLQELTKEKFLVQFDSDIESAGASLEALKSTLDEEKIKLQEMEEQINACVMYAPSDGVVVYANKYSSRGGSAEFVVEPGANVRERQTIIRLPDPAQMQVKAKVNESRVALVGQGMPCRISVASLEGLELLGRVTKVNRYAEPSSFFTSSIKEYACYIEILDPPESIRTGMTAEVQIFVQQKPNALQMPVQGVYEHGGKTFALVKKGGKFETREIEVDATNDKMAAIAKGLTEGDEVVLNLRKHLDLMKLPELSDDTNSKLASRIESKTGEKVTNGPPKKVIDGPSEGAGEKRGKRGPGGGGPRGGGGGSGGGRPSPAALVQSIFSESDTDGDGKLSESELSGMSDRRRGMAKQADKDGDGFITKAELTSAMSAMFSAGGGGGGRPGGGGR